MIIICDRVFNEAEFVFRMRRKVCGVLKQLRGCYFVALLKGIHCKLERSVSQFCNGCFNVRMYEYTRSSLTSRQSSKNRN